MAQFRELPEISQMAGRLLRAWRSGENAEWTRQLEIARLWAAHRRPSSTLEMETLEVLTGALESLGQRSRTRGAIRLLEQLADRFAPQASAATGWRLLPGKPAVALCSQFVQ